MTQSAHRPWSFVAGAVMALVGFSVALASQLWPGFPLGAVVAALLAGAVVEFVTGESLRRHGGDGMAHLASALTIAGLGGFMLVTSRFETDSFSAAPVALMTGIICLLSAGFRALAVGLGHTTSHLLDALDIVVTLGLGVALLARWRGADASLVGLIGGFDLVMGGFSISRNAWSMWRHPEWDEREPHPG